MILGETACPSENGGRKGRVRGVTRDASYLCGKQGMLEDR